MKILLSLVIGMFVVACADAEQVVADNNGSFEIIRVYDFGYRNSITKVHLDDGTTCYIYHSGYAGGMDCR